MTVSVLVLAGLLRDATSVLVSPLFCLYSPILSQPVEPDDMFPFTVKCI